MFVFSEVDHAISAFYQNIFNKKLNREDLDIVLAVKRPQSTYNHLAFVLAASDYHDDVARVIELGANVAAALHGYVHTRNVERVQALLKPGIDINYMHPLYPTVAADGCQLSPVSLIMRALYDLHYERANNARGLSIVELLLAHKPDLDLGVDHDGSTGSRPLIWAASRTDGYLQRFLAAGADPSITEKFGWSPLMATAWNHLPDNCRLLLEAGAETESATSYNPPALMIAVIARCRPVMQLLLDYGANAAVTDGSGKTPLMLAMFPDHRKMSEPLADIPQLLIESGVAVNAVDTYGESALTLAAETYSVTVAGIKALLEGGADVKQMNVKGESALSKIIFKEATPERIEIIELLLRAGADPFQPIENTTLLHKLIDSSEYPEQLRCVITAILNGYAPAVNVEKLQEIMDRLVRSHRDYYLRVDPYWEVTSEFYNLLLAGNIENLAIFVERGAQTMPAANAAASQARENGQPHRRYLKSNIVTARGSVPQLLLHYYNQNLFLGEAGALRIILLEKIITILMGKFDLNPYRITRVPNSYLYESAYSLTTSVFKFFNRASQAIGLTTAPPVESDPTDRLLGLPASHALQKVLVAMPSHLKIFELLATDDILQVERVTRSQCQFSEGIVICDYKTKEEQTIITEQYREILEKEIRYLFEMLNDSDKYLPIADLNRINKLLVKNPNRAHVPAAPVLLTAAEGEQARRFLAGLQDISRAVLHERAPIANQFRQDSAELAQQVTMFDARG